jgi:hypothetical protein
MGHAVASQPDTRADINTLFLFARRQTSRSQHKKRLGGVKNMMENAKNTRQNLSFF